MYFILASSVSISFSSRDSFIISKAYVDRIGSSKGADTLVKILGKNDYRNMVAPIGYLGYIMSSEVHVLVPKTDLFISVSNLARTRWYLSDRNELSNELIGAV